jgi:hypothetical protein|tara:strand:+ start:3342 stop:3518 length:177 start_codon:yes stop_codon:yes gene_type:complete
MHKYFIFLLKQKTPITRGCCISELKLVSPRGDFITLRVGNLVGEENKQAKLQRQAHVP